MIRSPPGCPATLIEEPVLTRSASFPHLWLAVLFAFSTAARLLAQAPDADTGRLSLESLYHPTLRKPLVGGANTQLAWLSDGVLQLMRSNAQKGGVELLKVDPQTWETTPLLDESAVLGALQKAGVAEGAAKQALLGGGLVWNQQRSAFVVAVGGDLYYVDIAQADGRRLTRTEGDEDEVLFSPDGARVAFLRGNDLYVSAAVDGVETRLTTDGSGAVFNGRLDWVYQEELYGRGNWRGFWWSPDSQKIAYLQLDESKVPTFTGVDHRPIHQRLLTANYPKVGDPNPTAKLGVVGVSGGATQWMADPYSGQEILISNVGWAPDGRVLAQGQNRAQTWADLLVFELVVELPSVLGLDLVLQTLLTIEQLVHLGRRHVLGEFVVDFVVLRQKVADRLDRLLDVPEHRLVRIEPRLLRHVTDGLAVLQARLAVPFLIHPGHDAHQRGLAAAVVADDADLRAVVKREGDVLQDLFIVVFLLEVAAEVDVLGHSGRYQAPSRPRRLPASWSIGSTATT